MSNLEKTPPKQDYDPLAANLRRVMYGCTMLDPNKMNALPSFRCYMFSVTRGEYESESWQMKSSQMNELGGVYADDYLPNHGSAWLVIRLPGSEWAKLGVPGESTFSILPGLLANDYLVGIAQDSKYNLPLLASLTFTVPSSSQEAFEEYTDHCYNVGDVHFVDPKGESYLAYLNAIRKMIGVSPLGWQDESRKELSAWCKFWKEAENG